MRATLIRWLTARHAGVPTWQRILLFVLIAVLAAWLGFKAVPASVAGEWIRQGGYYVLAGIFAWWIIALLRSVRSEGHALLPALRARFGRSTCVALVWIVGLTAVALFTVPRSYKVLFDEGVIQSTAWNMHRDRDVGASNRAYEVGGTLRSLDTYLDKRPYFFPFLVSLLHDLSGYRESNAFALNAALMPVVLLLLYALARRLAGREAGHLAIVSLGAFSLLAINASSAGLEMLNLALVLALMLVARRYLERPDENGLTLVVLTAVLLANTRYESAIYVGCAALVIVEGWRRADRIILPAAGLLAPLLLVPYALHNTYLSGTPRLWELREGMEARFSFDYLQLNLGYAWTFFTHLGPRIANSIWMTVAGLVALLTLVFFAWRRRPAWADLDPAVAALVLCSLGVLGNLALLMAYYWGDLSDPVVSRLSLPLHALLALLIACATRCVPLVWRTGAISGGIVAACVLYLAFGIRVNQSLHTLNGVEESSRWEESFIAARGPARRLMVTDKSPLLWFVRGVPAITPSRLNSRSASVEFHLAHHTFDEVLVTQTLSPATEPGEYWMPNEHRLPDRFVLEVLGTRRIGTRLHRICLLKEIRPADPTVDDPALRSPAPEETSGAAATSAELPAPSSSSPARP